MCVFDLIKINHYFIFVLPLEQPEKRLFFFILVMISKL